MRLSNEQYEFIKNEVVSLFEMYNVRCIPINGFEIAQKMRIKLIPYSMLTNTKYYAAMKISTEGFYMEDNTGQGIVFYNDNVSYERLNMTLLHEIGHCVLDHKDGSETEEAEANFFAKYAAAPPLLIDRLVNKSPESIEDNFCISHTAAIYACNYYQKWKTDKAHDYTNYEVRLLHLFCVA